MAVDLSNGTEWSKIHEQVYLAQAIPGKPNKFYRIPLIIVPTFLDSHTVAISVNTSSAKKSWNYAGEAFQLVRVSSPSDIGLFRRKKSESLLINEVTQISFEVISTYYRLAIQLPHWFRDAFVQAWIFLGHEPNTINQELDEVRTQLDRIEEKVDAITSNP